MAGATVGIIIGLLSALSILQISSNNKEEKEKEEADVKKNDDLMCNDVGGSVRREKVKRPSQMPLINSEFGSVVETERELREEEANPTF